MTSQQHSLMASQILIKKKIQQVYCFFFTLHRLQEQLNISDGITIFNHY